MKCPDKRRYCSERAALRAARRRGLDYAAYPCDCGWFHLTHRKALPVTPAVAALEAAFQFPWIHHASAGAASPDAPQARAVPAA